MRILSLLLLSTFLPSCGGDDAGESCDAPQACQDFTDRYCECCPDPPGGHSCSVASDKCDAAKEIVRAGFTAAMCEAQNTGTCAQFVAAQCTAGPEPDAGTPDTLPQPCNIDTICDCDEDSDWCSDCAATCNDDGVCDDDEECTCADCA